jgi:phosphate transport system protein
MQMDHTFKRFDDELDRLLARVHRMGALVLEQLALAERALTAGDAELARRIIPRDDQVDSHEVKIDKLGMRLFALQQPVAQDLRVVMAALAVNRHIERIGDSAVNLARRIPSFLPQRGILHETRLPEMLAAARGMTDDALAAFARNDLDLARSVAARDEGIDDLDRENFSCLLALMARDPQLLAPASHLLLVNRAVERIGDEATNIAEAVAFVVTGRIVRHRAWWTDAADRDTAPDA